MILREAVHGTKLVVHAMPKSTYMTRKSNDSAISGKLRSRLTTSCKNENISIMVKPWLSDSIYIAL